jgi:hypothetical protein
MKRSVFLALAQWSIEYRLNALLIANNGALLRQGAPGGLISMGDRLALSAFPWTTCGES